MNRGILKGVYQEIEKKTGRYFTSIHGCGVGGSRDTTQDENGARDPTIAIIPISKHWVVHTLYYKIKLDEEIIVVDTRTGFHSSDHITMWVIHHHCAKEGWDISNASRLQGITQNYTQQYVPLPRIDELLDQL